MCTGNTNSTLQNPLIGSQDDQDQECIVPPSCVVAGSFNATFLPVTDMFRFKIDFG